MGSNCCLQLPWECCRSLFSCHAIFFQTESSCCLSKMHLYRNVLETSLASSLDSKYEGIGKLYFLIEQICPFIWHSCEKLFFRPMSVHLCPMGKRFTMGICANKPPEKSGICAERHLCGESAWVSKGGSNPANQLLYMKLSGYSQYQLVSRISSINSRVDRVWFTSSNQTVASEGFTVTGWFLK